ncbi:hypothetical protein BDQ17DRAFT_1536333 [Cyathus striatus]|nr:hypothetical protein BDQ17DRAFT_1536333 [Cyathus striatus]
MHCVPRRTWAFSLAARLPRAQQARLNFTAAHDDPSQNNDSAPPPPSFGNWDNLVIPDRDTVKIQKSTVKRKLLGALPSSYRPDMGYLGKAAPESFASRLLRIRPKTIGGDDQPAASPPNAFNLRRNATQSDGDSSVAQRRAARLARQAAAASSTASSMPSQEPRETSGLQQGRDQSRSRGMGTRQDRQQPRRRAQTRTTQKEDQETGDDGRGDEEVDRMLEAGINPKIEEMIWLEVVGAPKMTSYSLVPSQYTSSDLSDVFGIPTHPVSTPSTIFMPTSITGSYMRHGVCDSSVYLKNPEELGAVQLAKLTLAHTPDISVDRRQVANTIIEDAVNMIPPPLKKIRPERIPIAKRRALVKKEKK